MNANNCSPACIVCQGSLTLLTAGRQLLGSTTRGDSLFPFSLQKCTICGHIQKEINTAWHESMQYLYERDYRFLGRLVNIVDGKIVTRDSLCVQFLNNLLDLNEAGDLLDVGCGAGTFLHAFLAEKSTWRVAGHELTDLHCERVLAGGASRYYTVPLDEIEQKFDLITLNHVVEHLLDPVSVLRAAGNLLKPGGHVVVRVPTFQAVYTDFYLMEHCSHFTYRTLCNTASLAGLSVRHRIEGLAAIETGFAATKSTEAPRIEFDVDAEGSALRNLAWAESLPDFIRQNRHGRPVGVFGVNGAGFWLGVAMRGELAFFVDEDVFKQGEQFAGCPIVGVNRIPENSVVFVMFNNPEASARLCQRLCLANPRATFIPAPAAGPIGAEQPVAA